jgi:protein-tyrosine-phosphatase
VNILFVCSANVSRSFLAERLLREEMVSLGIKDVFVSSAGIHAFPGSPADPRMVEHLAGMGFSVPAHEARAMSREDAKWADLILVMEKAHAQTIRNLWPGAEPKVRLLGRCLPGSGIEDDIMDPFARSPYHYRLAQSQITLAVKALARWLASERGKGSPCSGSR